MEDKRIKVVINWPKPKQFIYDFSKIARLFISMLKTVILLKNLLILVNVAEKDKVVGRNISDEIIKYLSKFQKHQNCQKLEV